jgi:hypothetical protein
MSSVSVRAASLRLACGWGRDGRGHSVRGATVRLFSGGRRDGVIFVFRPTWQSMPLLRDPRLAQCTCGTSPSPTRGNAMRLPTFIPTVACLALVAGCVSTYQQKTLTAPAGKLAATGTVAIATPEDGSYNGKPYPGSGAATAQALRSAFARYSNGIRVSSQCRDVACLRAEAQADAYVVPQILHWEDRNTEWSGKKDKIEIKITVYDGKSGSELSNQLISGKSKWATFGGDHPQDLLQDPLDAYVATLY